MKNFHYPLPLLFLISVISVNQLALAQKLIQTIPVEGRNITNLSGAFNDSISFHIIINKIEKMYHSKIYFLDKNQEISSFEIHNESAKPNYLCFHVNDDLITLISQTKDEKIIIEDVHYLNGKTSSSKINVRLSKILSHKHLTVLVGQKTNQSYPIVYIKNSSDYSGQVITPKNEIERKFLTSFALKSEFINDKQFLSHGPILDYKGFFNGQDLVFVNDRKSKGHTDILFYKPSGLIVHKSIPIQKKSGLKKLSSFIKDSLLFSFRMYSEYSYLDIYDLNSQQKLKTFNYTKYYFGPHNKIVMRGKDITDDFLPKKFYKDFSPQTIGSVYLPALYVAVNKSNENDYILRIGHLDKNSYRNKTTNNFWWNNNAFMVVFDLKSGGALFNPAAFQMAIFKAFADAKNTGNFFELHLDQSLNQIDDFTTFEYYEIDEEVYDNFLQYSMVFKHHFYIPQKDYVRFINYDKTLKEYKIYNLPLKL